MGIWSDFRFLPIADVANAFFRPDRLIYDSASIVSPRAPRHDLTMTQEMEQAQGSPFVRGVTPVDQWSLAIYDALRDWPIAGSAAWQRWEPGYLVLEISRGADGPLDPIMLATDEEELTVTLGYWETHLPTRMDTDTTASGAAAREAKELVEDWLAGRLLTAVYFGADERWCGSITVEPDNWLERLQDGAEWIKEFGPTRGTTQTASRRLAALRRFQRQGHSGAGRWRHLRIGGRW